MSEWLYNYAVKDVLQLKLSIKISFNYFTGRFTKVVLIFVLGEQRNS